MKPSAGWTTYGTCRAAIFILSGRRVATCKTPRKTRRDFHSFTASKAPHAIQLIDAGSIVQRRVVTIRQRKMKGQEHSAHPPDEERIRTYSITTSSYSDS